MLEYPIANAELLAQRAKFVVSDNDWFSFDSFLTVALHNGLAHLAHKGNSHPANKTWEIWQQELLKIVAKLKWLNSFDQISMDLYEWTMGDVEMSTTPTEHNTHLCHFEYEKPENSEWYYNEASPALEARKQQIINDVFDWLKINFQDLWD